MDKETELLSRLAANHLSLAQFEPLRATLHTLRSRNPNLALIILQTIVANSGRFEGVLWSASCPSPSLLTYLSTLELLQFDDSTSSSAWSFDADTLRLRAEFLLLIQMLIDGLSKRTRKDNDAESLEREEDKDGERVLDESEGLGEESGEFVECLKVLNKFMELGVKRLKPDVDTVAVKDVDSSDSSGDGEVVIEEDEVTFLKKVVLEYPDIFDALSWNLQRQLRGWEGFDSSRAIVRKDENKEEDKMVLELVQRTVQLAHLEAMKKCINEEDDAGAFVHIRFLHLEYGVDEAQYR